MGTTTAAPEADRLFKVFDERKTQYLLENQAQDFHHTVAQMMLLSAR